MAGAYSLLRTTRHGTLLALRCSNVNASGALVPNHELNAIRDTKGSRTKAKRPPGRRYVQAHFPQHIKRDALGSGAPAGGTPFARCPSMPTRAPATRRYFSGSPAKTNARPGATGYKLL